MSSTVIQRALVIASSPRSLRGLPMTCLTPGVPPAASCSLDTTSQCRPESLWPQTPSYPATSQASHISIPTDLGGDPSQAHLCQRKSTGLGGRWVGFQSLLHFLTLLSLHLLTYQMGIITSLPHWVVVKVIMVESSLGPGTKRELKEVC